VLLDRGRIDLEGLLGLPELLDLGLDADQSIALGRLWSQITLFVGSCESIVFQCSQKSLRMVGQAEMNSDSVMVGE